MTGKASLFAATPFLREREQTVTAGSIYPATDYIFLAGLGFGRDEDEQIERGRFTVERLIGVLTELAAGAKSTRVARKNGASKATLYNLKARIGGFDAPETKRTKQFDGESSSLKGG